MKQIKFKDIQLIPIVDSDNRKKISDEVYFSKEYSGYISNSRLKYINPEENGSPTLYLNPPHFSTNSLKIGRKILNCL